MARPPRLEACFGLAIGLIGLAAFATIVMRLPSVMDVLVSADALYFPDLGDDLLHRLGEIDGWQLAPAPRFFPDLAIFVAIQALVHDFRLAILLNGGVQLALFAHAGFLIARRIDPTLSPLAFQAVLLAILGGILGLGWLIGGPFILAWYQYAFLPGFHFGGLLALLWSVLLAQGARTDGRGGHPLRLGTAVILFGISDLFYLAQFVFPYLVAGYALAQAHDRSPRLGRDPPTVAAAAVLAFLLGRAAAPSSGNYLQLSLKGLLGSAGRQIALLWRHTAGERIVSLLILAAAGALTTQAVRLWREHWHGRAAASPEGFILLLLALSIVTSLALPIPFHLTQDDGSLRYLLPVAFIPPLWLAGKAAGIFEALCQRWGGTVLLAVAALAPAAVLSEVATATLLRDGIALARWLPPPAALACFPGETRATGLAQYWPARPLSLFSDRRLQLAEVSKPGTACAWMSNRAWAERDRQSPEQPAHFGFILMDRLDPRAVALRYGPPLEVERCAGSELWRYDPAVLTARFLADPPTATCW